MEFNKFHPEDTYRPELSSHMMESLFFSCSVYEPTPDSVLQDLQQTFGKVEPLMVYGFAEEADNQQASFVARSPTGRIIVACRGTAGFRDIVADLKGTQSRLSFVKGAAAHWGFADRAESVPIDYFCELLGAGEELIFTGHSLGGAVASLLCLRVLESSKGLYDEQVHCITFGCPLFASSSLAELINSNYKEVFTHIVSRRDVVPKILPFVSTLHKLVCAGEDHLEGLLVLKNVLSLLPGVPLVALISGIERRVPSLLKFLFRGFMKLAFPTGLYGSYAFAGHIVMLDSEGPLERSLVLANADDMNMWHSQLGFAFGNGFDGTMIEQHKLKSYHNGILRSLSHVRVGRDISLFDGGDAPSLESFRLQKDCAKGFNSDGKFKQQQQQQSLLIRFTPPESGLSTEVQFRGDFGDENSPSSITVTQSARDCGDGSCNSPLRRTISAQFGTPSKSWKFERSLTSRGGWAPRSRVEEGNVLVTSSSSSSQGLTIRCRACSHLRMHMKITACCHKVHRKRLGFGWVLGTIGRLSRHLRILDNLCFLTFVRIVVSNLLG